jgi:hypothetical protein
MLLGAGTDIGLSEKLPPKKDLEETRTLLAINSS